MASSSDFVGSVVGESQKKTNAMLEKARGKVLVIDEAYNLDDNNYGKQVRIQNQPPNILGMKSYLNNLSIMKVERNLTEEDFNPANIYLFKFNNRNTRKKSEICSKLTIKTPERRQ